MKRLEIYIDSKEQLKLEIYNNENDKDPNKVYAGRKCYPVIEKYCDGKIRKMKKLNPNDITLYYKHCFIDVFYYKSVLRKNGTNPILNDLCDYKSKLSLKRNKKKRVQRKVKYAKKKMILTTIGLFTLSSVIGTSIYALKQDKFDAKTLIKTEKEKDIEVDIENEDVKNIVEQAEQEVEEQVKKESDVEEIVMSFSYEDYSDTEKAINTKNNYGDLLNKYSKQYGIDPIIMTGIATQERGVHSRVKDEGGATGLMQIQNGPWVGRSLTAYNYNTNQNETIIVDEAKLSDLEYNIKVGCMIFQNNIKEMNNNMIAAIQCYNLGSTNMRKILRAYSNQTGRSIDAILSDINDNGWLECRDILGIGDPEYIEHVFSWIGDEVTLNNVENNGKLVNLCINNKNETKSISIN